MARILNLIYIYLDQSHYQGKRESISSRAIAHLYQLYHNKYLTKIPHKKINPQQNKYQVDQIDAHSNINQYLTTPTSLSKMMPKRVYS